MHSRLFKSFIIVVIMLLYSVSSAEVILQIIPDSRLSDSQIIYLSDFDFMEVGDLAENLFTIQIISDADYTNCVMTVRLLRDQDELAFLRTRKFNLPTGTFPISNIDLVNETFDFYGSSAPIRIDKSGVSDGAVKNITDELYSSGQLPIGNYDLKVELSYNSSTQPLQTDTDHPFFISNPTMINLVSPGAPVGMGAMTEVYNEFPVFQWNGNSGNFQVLVFEQKNEFQSIDDILNSFPNWQSERLNVLSVQYPSVGTGTNPVIPLEFGKTYYWLLKMFVQTSSGENEILSEIWQFTLVDPTKLAHTPDNLAMEDIQRLLSDLLGTQQAEEIAKGVSDFQLKTIRINGRPITVQELYQIIDQYRGQELQILDLIMQQSN